MDNEQQSGVTPSSPDRTNQIEQPQSVGSTPGQAAAQQSSQPQAETPQTPPPIGPITVMEGPLEASKQTSTEGPIQVNSVNHKHRHALLVILGIIILAGLGGGAFALLHSSQQPKKTVASTTASAQSSKATSTASSSLAPAIQAAAQSYAAIISMHLTAYNAIQSSYPASLDAAQINSVLGSSGPGLQQLEKILTPPSGEKYSYVASPKGCSTAANNCTSYTLSVIQISNGQVLATVTPTN